ncbi:MAG: sulfide/dihydroorotate dehydrogenase-like FAD/NAD-binding protein [Candidatus Aminicenantes bacterium]|nr:sulfide/dihydroorotate dehydrogenase-like FAD/NAD-binding protein [Candidatus Aminicenantes bacterium]MDH5704754.1 sulfide/dihydroorotate dehydrogenase-like FAD/NAD-binding protein [Candidatus Aminicenantes bacterium]
MAKILQRERLVPNIHLIEIHSPEIARKCQPGQFVIVMPDEKGERIPLTIADWNRDKGTVTSVFMVVGTSTHKLSLLKAGDEVPVFVGPLGRPSKIEKFGTVLCAGGCFGIAAIYPIARALKEAGNKVITLLDVKANYLLYWEDRLKAVSDKFVVSSRDSFFNCKDYIPRVLGDILKKEKKVDRVISVGCTYLIYTCSEATRPKGIRTIVSLNPIMVDGTGMCGACRVTIGGKTKFACVDGPDFDGHQVDWEELFTRRKSYFEDEIDSLNYWEKINFP